MTHITRAQALKEIRKAAKEVGLIFKRTNTKLNGVYLWKFEDKRRGNAVMTNCQFWTAYENVCSGYISSFNKPVPSKGGRA